MENKYFTPAIEDIHAGYECELLLYAKWEPNTVKPYTALKSVVKCIKDKVIRVSYLTKEQIEAEGWFLHGQGNDNGIVHSLFKNSFRVAIWKDSLKIEVQESEGNILFHGECKDINTFRTICKLLKIN